MTPTLEEQTRRWQAFAAQVAQLANEHGIDGIAMAGLIRYEEHSKGGFTVLGYAAASPELDWESIANCRPWVLDCVEHHFDKAVALLDDP